MSASARVPRLVDAVERVAGRAAQADEAAHADEFLESIAAEVRKAIPYDGSMWFGVDPSTMLALAPARMERLDEGYCQPFWHGEFHEHDVNLFSDLARAPLPAASLRSATDDRPLRSSRYRTFLQPQGYDDELRVVFRCGARAWGVAALFREKGRDPFDASDAAAITAISGLVAQALRAQAVARSAPPALSHAPGLMLFSGDGMMVSANAEATRWLGELYGTDGGTDWIRYLSDPSAPDLDVALPIIPLLARARAIAAGRHGGQARARGRDRSGRWVVLHASSLEGAAGDGTVAVVVEPAKGAEVAPIIIEAYGLTPRERDVVQAIARGASTPDIAAELFLSGHTVRDYIKSVFEKVGVNSRAELVAKLFAEHYADPFHQALIDID